MFLVNGGGRYIYLYIFVPYYIYSDIQGSSIDVYIKRISFLIV